MATIQVEKHQPERRRPAVTTVYCGCSCCCCCLHTLGSIVGAAVAPVFGSSGPRRANWAVRAMTPSDDDIDIRLPPRRISAVGFFWWLSVALTALVLFAIALMSGGSGSDSLMIGGVLILLVFPAIQLVAAVISAVVYACIDAPDRSYQLGRIGRVTAGIACGSIFGILAMVGIGFILSR